MDNYYVYFHKKPDGEVFYVGKGKNNRAYNKRPYNKYWTYVATKYTYSVEFVTVNLSENLALELEELLITEIKLLNRYKLTNICNGGVANSGYKHTKEHKDKVSKLFKGNTNWLGKKHKPETKLKMSLNNKRISPSEEHRKKLSERRRGVPVNSKTREALANFRKLPKTEEHRKKLGVSKYKKVEQYSLDGVLLNVWDSITELCKNGFERSSVRKASNNSKVYKNFKWKILQEK